MIRDLFNKLFNTGIFPVVITGGLAIFLFLQTPLLDLVNETIAPVPPASSSILAQELATCKKLLLRKRFFHFEPATRCNVAFANEPRDPKPAPAKGNL